MLLFQLQPQHQRRAGELLADADRRAGHAGGESPGLGAPPKPVPAGRNSAQRVGGPCAALVPPAVVAPFAGPESSGAAASPCSVEFNQEGSSGGLCWQLE